MRKFVIILSAMFLLFFLIGLIRSQSQGARTEQEGGAVSRSIRAIGDESMLTRAEALEKVKEAWVRDQKLLRSYESEQSKIREEIIKRRRLFRDGEMSKAEVVEAEQAFVTVSRLIYEVRRSMIESDMAITEATARDGPSETPLPAVNDFRGSTQPTPYYSAGRWSLQHSKNIEKFFLETFGRNLPVTAYGQTAAHSRMRFDHRDAMDVGIHPDSAEGRALIDYLRRSGIPHVPFRGAVAGSSTGAHIHIGQPSRRAAVN
jgi:hypothetical protein